MFDTEWVTVEERRVLPEVLEEMEPGPELGSILASVDRSQLNGHELVIVLAARARQIAHLQAELYTDVWELALTPPGDVDSPPDRTGLVDDYVSDELGAALRLSPRAADNHLSLAYELSYLPQVRDALRRGLIDLTRARIFCQETAHLEPGEAHSIVDELIEDAPRLTAGQLGSRLRRRCMEKNPKSARRRYEEGVKGRRVEGRSNPDGTADILARQLPVDRVGSILSRINAIARQLNGQDDRSIDQIRADILMDLLEGRHSHTEQGTGGVEIRVDLTTLLALDDRAAEMPGWGPVISDLARQVVRQQADSQWQAVVTDAETGQPLWTGTTRRRPTTSQKRHVRARNPVCVFPGCHTPATRTHTDHTIDYARSGTTAVTNLGPLCPRHHLRTKHRAGWQLQQPEPGYFTWTSPRGHHYETRPPPR